MQLEMVRLLAGAGVAQHHRGRRRRPGHLSLARRRRRQPARVPEVYPGCREVVLDENHRSTQPILDAASRLISYNNPYRLEVVAGIDKRLRAQRPGGVAVRHVHFDTGSAEADGVASMIDERLRQGFRPRDVAILVRTNDDADAFLRALNVKGIPHRFSGSRGLYAREEVRLLVSFLRTLAHPDDSVSAFYLAASDLYRIPETDLLRLNQYARRKSRPLLEVLRGLPVERGPGRRRRRDPRRRGSGCSRTSTARRPTSPRLRTGEVLYKFLQESGLLARLSRDATPEAEARVKNIARFFESVKAYGDVAEHDRVTSFVTHLDLLREAGDDPAVAEADPDEDAVHVLTVHKAKGLEFPVVFLVGLRRAEVPGAAPSRPDPASRRPGEGDPGAGRRPSPRGAAPLLRRDDARQGRAGPHVGRRLRHGAGAQGLALRRRGARPSRRRRRSRGRARRARRWRAISRCRSRRRLPRRPIPEARRAAALVDADRRLPHLSAEVPLRPHPPRPAPDPPSRRLRQRDPQGGAADVRGAPRRSSRSARTTWSPRSTRPGSPKASSPASTRSAVSRRERRRCAASSEEEADIPGRPRPSRRSSRSTGDDEASRLTRVQGRYDLVVESDDHVTILDFKTGAVDDAKKAKERAKESLQLDVYALAHLKTKGRLPDWVELRFLESGLAGRQAADSRGGDADRGADPRGRGASSAGASSRRRLPGTPAASAPSVTSVPTPRAGRRRRC